MNGLGLCMFTIADRLPAVGSTSLNAAHRLGRRRRRELLRCGERIQNLRHAFNVREGLRPADFVPPPRIYGQGDGLLAQGPLRGITVPIERLRRDYHAAMRWSFETGCLSRARAAELGMEELLAGYLDEAEAPAGAPGHEPAVAPARRRPGEAHPGQGAPQGTHRRGLAQRGSRVQAAGGRDAHGPARRGRTRRPGLRAAIAESPHLRHTLMLNGERVPLDDSAARPLVDGDELYLLGPIAGGEPAGHGVDGASRTLIDSGGRGAGRRP